MRLLFLFYLVLFISCYNESNEENFNSNDNNHQKLNLLESNYYVSNLKKGDSLLSGYYNGLINRKIYSDNINQSISFFKKSLIYASQKDSVIPLNKLGECYLIIKDYEKAVIFLEKSILIDKTNYNSHLLLANAFSGNSNKLKSINILLTLIDIDTIEIDDRVECNLLLGHMYAESFDKQCLVYYDNVLDLEKDNVRSLYGKGLFYQNMQEYSSAVDMYHEIKKYDPFNINANFNLGFIFMELKDYNIAINYFSDVIVENNDYYKAFFARGICYEKKGDIFNAEKDYRTALNIFPQYQEARSRLDKILEDNLKYN